MLGPTGHIDHFARENLPPDAAQPDFLLDGFQYPDHLNAGVAFTQGPVKAGGARMAVFDDTCGNLIQIVELQA